MPILFKKLSIVFVLALFLTACKPSDKYAGEWFAITNEGDEVMVDFSKEKEMTITYETGQNEDFTLNQSSTGFINQVSYFGIEIDKVKHYIVFENKKDENNAVLVKQTNNASDFKDVVGDIIFNMSRDGFPEQ